MSSTPNNVNQNLPKRRLASEVLELGQSLFEVALETRDQQATEGQEVEPYPIDELQAATQEFFSALRLLFGIEI